jgi:uncharacterized tellurite resistance protein B-like protein
MADWRKVAIAALLADGIVDESEVKVLKKELYADGKIDKKEVEFLIDLRVAAQKKAKGEPLSSAFENLFFKAVQENVLADGNIQAREVAFLRKAIMADGKVDDSEKSFLKRLKKGAKTTSSAFEKLCEECGV